MDMDIGDVVRAMKADPTKRFARNGWNGKNMYIQLQVPDEHSKMTLPYVYMKTAQGDLVPWLCSASDLLAEDYFEVRTMGAKAVKIADMTFREALVAVTKSPSQVYSREGKTCVYMFYDTEFGDVRLKKGSRPLSMDDGRRFTNAVADGTLSTEDLSATDWNISGWGIYYPKGE